MISLPSYQDSSLFSFEWYHNISMHKNTQATAGSPGRPSLGKHMAGTGRLEGSTACRRPTRPMKIRPVWIPDLQDTRQSLGESLVDFRQFTSWTFAIGECPIGEISESRLGMLRGIF